MLLLIEELAEPSKRQILTALRSGPQSVSDLVRSTGMKQPNVSNHLAKMKAKGLVKSTKIGRQVFYGLDGPQVESALLQLLESSEQGPTGTFNLEEISKLYARAATSADEAGCAKLIDQLLDQSVPLIDIYQKVIAESMNYIGRWYEVEAIDVGQEHIASAITERMMARVVHYAPTVKRSGKSALVGCIAGNWHSIGPRMISDYLRLSGWNVIFLGANVPNDSFLSSIREHSPDVVMIACAQPGTRQATCVCIAELVSERAQLGRAFRIGIGGREALSEPDEFLNAGADFASGSLDAFSEAILPKL